MMKTTEKVRVFLIGFTTALLAVIFIVPASAATALKQIQVAMGGIRIYLDGQLQTLKDVNGNKVEPMIYNGTTYLPVRALTGMLTDKAVGWDGASQSVYIGTKPVSSLSHTADLLDHFEASRSSTEIFTGDNAKFSCNGIIIAPSKRCQFYKYSSATFKVDSRYSRLSCMVAPVEWDAPGSNDVKQEFTIYEVTSHFWEGGIEKPVLGKILYQRFFDKSDRPIHVEADISGCNYIYIESSQADEPGRNQSLALYNAELTPAQ